MTVQKEGRSILSNNKTDIWKLYEEGRDFQTKLNLVGESTQNYRFYEGDHWHGLDSNGEEMPVVEIIKPVVDYKTTILTQNHLQAIYSSQNYDATFEERQVLEDVCDKLSNHFNRFWENNSLDCSMYDIVKDAIITGDSYAYLYFNPSGKVRNGRDVDGEIVIEQVDNTSIMFADENERDIQKQRHILILYRRQVKDVREEAKRNGISQDRIDSIVSDDDKDQVSGRTDEVNNKAKCLCIMKLWKETNEAGEKTVHCMKSTKNVVYQEDTDLTISSYPVVSYVWEPRKGLCRGVSDVHKYIPNQIWVNKIEAYRLIAAKMNAFPKMVYSAEIVNPEDINSIGAALQVQEGSVVSAMQSIGYINPAPMSGDAKMVLDELMTYTKDAAGASDIATGRERSDNYSALLAVQEAAAAPLNRQTERLKKFYEDMARILFDMWCNYYPNGLTIEDDDKEVVVIPQAALKDLKVQVRVDVTPVSPLNRLTEQQKADNLLMNQIVSFEEYVDLLPNDEPMKPKLEKIMNDRQERQMQQAMMQQQINDQAQMLEEAAAETLQNRQELAAKDEELNSAREEAYMEAAIANAAAKNNEGE